ncbi:MAG: hypothetical protein ACN6O3_11965 [Comamonas sp.]
MNNALTATDYAAFLRTHLPTQDFNVVRYELPGESVWLKRAGPPIAAWRYRLLGLLARLLKVDVLRPVVNPGGREAIATEVQRLRDLAARGLRVPTVLAAQEDGFLMRHLGAPDQATPSLADEIESAARHAPQQALWLWRRGFAAMQRVHGSGTCLSQGFARNMVRCPDDVIGYIDFEDDPLATLPRELCIVKDALCYAHSTALFLRQAGMLDAARQHWRQWHGQLDAATREALDTTLRQMRWVGRLPDSRRLGRDTQRLRAVYDLLAA